MPHPCILIETAPHAQAAPPKSKDGKTHIVDEANPGHTLCGKTPIYSYRQECDCHPVVDGHGTCGPCESACQHLPG